MAQVLPLRIPTIRGTAVTPGRWVLLAAVCVGLSAPPAWAQTVPEGCYVTNPPTHSPNPCTYTAMGDAAYAGLGKWRVTIIRRGITSTVTSDSAPAIGAPGAIRSGDVVTAEAVSVGSSIVVARTALTNGAAGLPCTGTGHGTGGPPSSAEPDDPLLAAQWGLRQIRAQQAWRSGRGRGATVAIIDTGVDLTHPDLIRRLVRGVDVWETRPGAAADCPGPQDEQYHGTMVAGVVAASADNGVGIAGVAPEASLMPVRVRDVVDSLDFSRVALGIRWAADHGADVISMTGGTVLPVRPAPVLEEQIAEAVEYAWSKGVVTVATAGNTSLPWCQYPAATDHIICAAANGPDGRPATYSNLPIKLGSGIALRAPGGARDGACDSPGDVMSTLPPGGEHDSCGDRGYGTDAGTTFATAHVAGVAALLAGLRLRNDEIVDCLRRTSSKGGTLDPLHGYGTVDAAAAVGCAPRSSRGTRACGRHGGRRERPSPRSRCAARPLIISRISEAKHGRSGSGSLT